MKTRVDDFDIFIQVSANSRVEAWTLPPLQHVALFSSLGEVPGAIAHNSLVMRYRTKVEQLDSCIFHWVNDVGRGGTCFLVVSHTSNNVRPSEAVYNPSSLRTQQSEDDMIPTVNHVLVYQEESEILDHRRWAKRCFFLNLPSVLANRSRVT